MDFVFTNQLRSILNDCEKANGKENKMRVILEFFQIVNLYLPNHIKYNKNIWIKFICKTVDKIMEFETEYRNGAWNKIDKKLVETFMEEINQAKKYIFNFIINYDVNSSNDNLILQTKANIENWIKAEVSQKPPEISQVSQRPPEVSQVSQRPRRNIPRVNYAGMA